MEGGAPAQSGQQAAAAGRKDTSIDPVQQQRILEAVTRKERFTAKIWPEKWGFYKQLRQIQEEEASKVGMSLEEFRAALRTLSCQPDTRTYPVVVDPSPQPLPKTTNGTIGHRHACVLERYGRRLVPSARDISTRPPLDPEQVYDPYKQTFFYLGMGGEGDPISYKLPPAVADVSEQTWAEPKHLTYTPFSLLHYIQMEDQPH